MSKEEYNIKIIQKYLLSGKKKRRVNRFNILQFYNLLWDFLIYVGIFFSLPDAKPIYF